MYYIIFNSESVLTEKADGFGKNIPLCLHHNSLLENLRGVALFYFKFGFQNGRNYV